jgi:hypothetical protein
MTDKITDYMGLETAARHFEDAIVSAFNDNCRLTAREHPLVESRPCREEEKNAEAI